MESFDYQSEKDELPLRNAVEQPACWQLNIAQAQSVLEHQDLTCSGDEEWRPDQLDVLLSAVEILDVNDEAIRLFSLPIDRDKALGRNIASLWPEQSRAALGDLITILATGTHKGPLIREIPTVDRFQHVVMTGWRATNIECRDTVFVCVRATVNTSNAVIELEASQKRYRNLISSLPIPVWQIDARPAGRIFDRLKARGITDMAEYSDEHPEIVKLTREIVQVFDVNNEAMELFGGKHRSEFIGPAAYLFSTTPGSARRVMLAHFSGVRNHVEELKVRTFDGRLLDVLLLMTFPVPGERLDTTILMMIDNTARLDAEAKLCNVQADFSHASRLSTLGEMTTSIAHEIKQPLSAILMNAQTSLRYLRRAEPNFEKIDSLTSRIVESAQRASDIIGRIQDMAGKRDATSTLLDFNDVVRQCVVFLRHESEDKNVAITTKLRPDLPAVRGDRIQLQQVIVNLIVNSIQAMKVTSQMQREIHLETGLNETGRITFAIRDTGTGIPLDHMDQIFDGFFTTKEGGLGIGLAICQSIIRAHGGEITASNHPQGGAKFHFALPADRIAEDEVHKCLPSYPFLQAQDQIIDRII